MEKKGFAILENVETVSRNSTARCKIIKDALDVIVKELNIEFGDFKVFVRQGKSTERIEINKSLHVNLNTH